MKALVQGLLVAVILTIPTLVPAQHRGSAGRRTSIGSGQWDQLRTRDRLRTPDDLHSRDQLKTKDQLHTKDLQKTQDRDHLQTKVEWTPKLRQANKTHFSANGEWCHGSESTEVHAGV